MDDKRPARKKCNVGPPARLVEYTTMCETGRGYRGSGLGVDDRRSCRPGTHAQCCAGVSSVRLWTIYLAPHAWHTRGTVVAIDYGSRSSRTYVPPAHARKARAYSCTMQVLEP